MAPVAVVDISPFTLGGDAAARQRAANELAKEAKANGCIGLKGHNISPKTLDAAFMTAKKLFDLPYEEKMKAPHPDGTTPHRGYSGIGREKVAAKTALETDDKQRKEAYDTITDCKETYEIGSEDNKVHYNIWLPEETFPGFRQFTTDFFWELNKLADAILDALMMSIGLSDDEARRIRSLHTGVENQLRLLHYPTVPIDGREEISRLGAHSDWSSFTLLFQDASGGLQFEDRSTGNFVAATPLDGVVYMNIGDMFQRLSNGYYPSALHRVIVPRGEGETVSRPRYSIPYFVTPLADAVIEPAPSRVRADGKRAYEPITFNSYSEEMFNRINVYS